jgi:hypothetical protein
MAAASNGARLGIKRGAAKAIYHAGANQKRVAEHKGLPAARELDRIFAESVGEEITGMLTDQGIFKRGVLRSVGSRRSRALRCQARSRVTVSAGQRADHADERVGVAEIEKWRFQFGERLDKALEPIPRRASLGERERSLQRRIGINVTGGGIDIADRETPEPGLDADREPVAILIIEHLVRLRRAGPIRRGDQKEHQLVPPTKYFEHRPYLRLTRFCASRSQSIE